MQARLKVLLIEDKPDKAADVKNRISTILGKDTLQWLLASTYEEALQTLSSEMFDIVIMDLLLPMAGGPPTVEASRSLIRMLLDGRAVPATHIFGLTEFRDVGEQQQAEYDSQLFSLQVYDPTSDDWAKRLSNRISYLVRSSDAAVGFGLRRVQTDVLLVTARQVSEYVPIKERLFGTGPSEQLPHWQHEVHAGEIRLASGRCVSGVLTCINEMGAGPAAAFVSAAVIRFRPRLVVMLGMCCGFKVDECRHPRKICDVIVAHSCACWEEGKFVVSRAGKRTFQSGGLPRSVSDDLHLQLKNAVEGEVFMEQLLSFRRQGVFRKTKAKMKSEMRDLPDVKYSMCVSGSSVSASEEQVLEILQRHPQAIGLDMEIFGVYTAVSFAFGRRPSVFAVKGVADYGDGSKSSVAQKCASLAACEVFLAIAGGLQMFR